MKGCVSRSRFLDTVGVISASPDVLENVMQVLLSHSAKSEDKNINRLIVLDDLLSVSTAQIRESTLQTTEQLASLLSLKIEHFSIEMLDEKNMSLSETLKILLCGETWESIGVWIEENNLVYGKNTRVDFSYMKSIDNKLLNAARLQQQVYADKLNGLLENSLVCIPTVPMFPRERSQAQDKKVNAFNYDMLRPFIALSSVAKLPQVTFPVQFDGFPCGVSIIGAKDTDLFLLDIVKKLALAKR